MIYFDNNSNTEKAEGYFPYAEAAINETLRLLKICPDCEISVSFVEKPEIKELNARYRDKKSVTDVLSFPMLDESEVEQAKNKPVVLGDIVICFEKAVEQSVEYGHSLEREIAFLTVHSVLHLLGYDHMDVAGETEMRDLQEAVLTSVGLARGNI